MNDVWLSSSIVAIPHGINEQDHPYHKEMYRSSEYWNRAKNLLGDNPSEFDLRDSISNLKKSVDLRFKLIEKIYKLRTIEDPGDKRKYMEILGDYDIIRPLLIKSLFEIRNLSEHEDAKPPCPERCEEFLDVVWYFLKSTDHKCMNKPEALEFDDFEDGMCDFTIVYRDIESKDIHIEGKIDKKYVSIDEKPDFYKMSVENHPNKHASYFEFSTKANVEFEFSRTLVFMMVAGL